MRLLLDTCAVVDLLTDPENLGSSAIDLVREPSNHIIISHAITEHLTLLSSDQKFPFYRNQGLDLIEY